MKNTELPASDYRVKRVVVAGGGTAGWVTATALVRHLGPLIDITLIESDAIGTIGVGESTVLTFRGFHELMKVRGDRFMAEAQATIKLGIEFKNWGRIGDRYIHPFGAIGLRWSWMADFHHFWLHAQAQGFGGDLATIVWNGSQAKPTACRSRPRSCPATPIISTPPAMPASCAGWRNRPVSSASRARSATSNWTRKAAISPR